jgi:hypothetical protein
MDSRSFHRNPTYGGYFREIQQFVVRQNNKNLKLDRERGNALKKYSPGLNPEKAPRW